jgi:hypothetical protein
MHMDDGDIPEFSACVKAARKAAGYRTQTSLVIACGVPRLSYVRAESGTQFQSSWKHIYRIIVGAGLPLECFFPRESILSASTRLTRGKRE